MNLGWGDVFPAPAKLNLFLHVVGRRTDGYHLLQTVFQFIDLADDLRYFPRDDGRIVLATPLASVADEDNLVVRAAKSLREAAGKPTLGATIALDKRIPMGGGLGGGSSDAATTLLALNRLWRLDLPHATLEALALTLGADVPVFVHGRNCFAEGIGERFTDLRLPPAWYLLTFPAVTVPTATIFAAPELPRATPPIHPAQWRPGWGRNDLEAVVCRRYPEVAHHLARLRAFGDARLSGSGATCFVPFPTCEAAEAARQRLPREIRATIARGLARHPLAAATDD